MIGVLLLTGALGAGKTTVLNELLAQTGLRVAVIENECGPVGIDGELLAGGRAWVLELTGGCVCCTLTGQLVDLLTQLAGQSAAFDHLVIELTGIADPCAVIAAFQADGVAEAFAITQIAAVVDASSGAARSADPWLWHRQLGIADTIILSHYEHASASALASGGLAIRAANATAPIVLSAAVTAEGLLSRRPPNRPAPPTSSPAIAEGEDDTRGYATAVVAAERPLRRDRLHDWMTLVAGGPDPQVLRIKGFVALQGSTRRHMASAASGAIAIRPDRRPAPACSRLVLIGRGLIDPTLQAGLERCQTGDLIPAGR